MEDIPTPLPLYQQELRSRKQNMLEPERRRAAAGGETVGVLFRTNTKSETINSNVYYLMKQNVNENSQNNTLYLYISFVSILKLITHLLYV